MARLVNPGAGEITDRLTILALKILAATEKDRPKEHFEQERHCLLAMIRSRTLNGVWFAQVLELGAVNGAIWQAEDELRGYRVRAGSADVPQAVDIVRCAFRLQTLNDQRAQIIHQINQDAGDALGAEKL